MKAVLERPGFELAPGQRHIKVPAIQVDIKAFDHRPLNETIKELRRAVLRTGGIISGPVRKPTRNEHYSPNRSPHIDKKSREQFVMRTHSWMVRIGLPSKETIEALMRLQLNSFVQVTIKENVETKLEIPHAAE